MSMTEDHKDLIERLRAAGSDETNSKMVRLLLAEAADRWEALADQRDDQ